MKQKMLLVLYQHGERVAESDLLEWVEYSNPAIFRRDILRKAHKEKLIEYNSSNRTIEISPKGIQEIEKILPSIEII